MAARTAHCPHWAQAGDCARSILANPLVPSLNSDVALTITMQVFVVPVPLIASSPTEHKHPGRSKGHSPWLLWHSWHS